LGKGGERFFEGKMKMKKGKGEKEAGDRARRAVVFFQKLALHLKQ